MAWMDLTWWTVVIVLIFLALVAIAIWGFKQNQPGQCCAFWYWPPEQPLMRSFFGIVKGCTKQECLYCKLKIPQHWAGRYNIFTSFLILVWYIRLAIFGMWMVFGIIFGIPGEATLFEHFLWWCVHLFCEFFILYTGWWSFEVRNELWQLIVRLRYAPFLLLLSWPGLTSRLFCLVMVVISWSRLRFGVALAWALSYKRHNAEYNGAIEYDSEGKAYGCSVAEYAATPEDCQAGGWGFTLVGIVGIFYSIAVFHTAVFGFLTWMKRIEAPPTSHGLGPKKPDVAVAGAMQDNVPVVPAQPANPPQQAIANTTQP